MIQTMIHNKVQNILDGPTSRRQQREQTQSSKRKGSEDGIPYPVEASSSRKIARQQNSKRGDARMRDRKRESHENTRREVACESDKRIFCQRKHEDR